MTAQIIQFGTIARQPRAAVSRQVIPDSDRSKASNEGMHIERDARDKAWRIGAATLRFFEQLLCLIDCAILAKEANAVLPDSFQSLIPADWESHHSERKRVLVALREAEARQLMLPAAYQSQVDWKRRRMNTNGLSDEQLARRIRADETFLALCPRKSGGRAKPRE